MVHVICSSLLVHPRPAFPSVEKVSFPTIDAGVVFVCRSILLLSVYLYDFSGGVPAFSEHHQALRFKETGRPMED